MNMLNAKSRRFGSEIKSNVRQANPNITRLTYCALLFAGFLLVVLNVKATNVLINPGAETGDNTGWNFDTFASVDSTNGYYYNGGISYPPTASNILAHTGEYVFKTYQIYNGDSTRIFQDVAAAPGSQWTANCYALSHIQDYISEGCNAHLQVVFYDNATNALAVYGSKILDPIDYSGYGDYPYIAVPPMAVDASGWTYLDVTNTYSGDPAAEDNYSGITTPPMVAPSGTAFVRYQLEYDNVSGAGGSFFWDDCDLDKVAPSDPDVVTAPTAQTVVVGQNATFTVVGSGSTGLSYQWKKGASNANGPRVGGANTATMTISNCLASDAGSYSVVISDSNGSIQTIPVNLVVLNPAAAANLLGVNAGFENAPSWSPWSPFNGTGLPSTNSTYYMVTNLVNVYDGKYCAQIYAGGTDNGFYRVLANVVTPGSVWKAAGHAYITSTTDNFSASNTCRVQVWFKDASGNQVGPTYESFKIYGLGYSGVYPMLPRDTWVYLPVTNIVDNTDTPTNSVQTFAAPAGAVSINFQVYYYHPGGTGGSVFWDDMELYQVIPTTATASLSGNNFDLSFATQGGSKYAVLYKNNITDASWNVLTSNIAGTGTTVTIQDPITGKTRFYRVQTQ